ncbi:MAG: (d)CMP kinase [Betaproteobacteria bacterium]|nr:(d)CMP kinase [Betaproteobacteria bacterium]
MRITIVGNSGSGKSTLAAALAAQLGASLLDLDAVYWEPDQIAVARDPAAARADVVAFSAAHDRWVVEGCYASLAEASLSGAPTLVFLNPGLEVCIAHCRARPWEPHKYASKQEQDARLAFLLDWVASYATRDDDMSLGAHRRVFDAYGGPKLELTAPVGADVLLERLATR